MSKLARALEQAGLIERAEHPDDSRAVQLTLTDRGREVTAQATERVQGLQDELTRPLGGLDSPATQALISSLHTLLDSGPPPAQTGPPPAQTDPPPAQTGPAQTGEDQ